MELSKTPNLPAARINLIVLVILSLFPLVGMGIDLIAPSLPAISHNLNTSATLSKNLIAIYLLGYALGNFVIGFLSDAWGRRKLIILGFVLFVFASLLPALLPYSESLLLARLLQGVAIASFAVLSRAILSDVLSGEKLLRTATMLATMWGIGPIIGPVIGGYLQFYFNWQACFYFFALYGLYGFVAMLIYVPETHLNRQPFNLKQIKINFITIITHRVFVGVVTMMGILYSLLIAFNTLGPFLIQTELGRSPIYFGHAALFMGVAFFLGTIVCRKLIANHSPEKIMLYEIIVFLAIALVAVILALIAYKNMAIIIGSSFLLFFGTGIIYPACLGKGLSLFRHLAGSGSAVMNLINILITCLSAFLMSFINARSAIPLTFIYLLLMLLCGLIFWLMIYSKNEN